MSEENKKAQDATDSASEISSDAIIEQLRADLAKAQAEAEKFQKDFLYLRADFDNYKKNAIKERSETLKYGSERLVIDLLELADNFERALEFEPKPENIQTLYQGIKMTQDALKAIFSRHGVTEMPALGTKFDPNVHDALGTEKTSSVAPGLVAKVFKKPYKLYDRIVRPAQVLIAEEPPAEGKSGD